MDDKDKKVVAGSNVQVIATKHFKQTRAFVLINNLTGLKLDKQKISDLKDGKIIKMNAEKFKAMQEYFTEVLEDGNNSS